MTFLKCIETLNIGKDTYFIKGNIYRIYSKEKQMFTSIQLKNELNIEHYVTDSPDGWLKYFEPA